MNMSVYIKLDPSQKVIHHTRQSCSWDETSSPTVMYKGKEYRAETYKRTFGIGLRVGIAVVGIFAALLGLVFFPFRPSAAYIKFFKDEFVQPVISNGYKVILAFSSLPPAK